MVQDTRQISADLSVDVDRLAEPLKVLALHRRPTSAMDSEAGWPTLSSFTILESSSDIGAGISILALCMLWAMLWPARRLPERDISMSLSCASKAVRRRPVLDRDEYPRAHGSQRRQQHGQQQALQHKAGNSQQEAGHKQQDDEIGRGSLARPR